MDYPVRQRLSHAIPQWAGEGSFFFITINCVPRERNQIACAAIGDAVLSAAVHYHEAGRWHCRLILLMPDHLHGIIAFPREPGMKMTIVQWKRYLARNHLIEWQRDFFDHRLRNHHAELEKID